MTNTHCPGLNHYIAVYRFTDTAGRRYATSAHIHAVSFRDAAFYAENDPGSDSDLATDTLLDYIDRYNLDDEEDYAIELIKIELA